MNRLNPLVTEAYRGLGRNGAAAEAWIAYLVIQAFVLLVWWPRQDLVSALEGQKGPDTLIAVLIVLGAVCAYYALRAGAEELLRPDEQSLREWVLATPLSLARIWSGYLSSHLLQTLFLTLLSLPLVLMALTVSGGAWPALLLNLVTIVVQATFYRLAGAVVCMAIGHLDAVASVLLRALMAVVYVGSLWLVPVASHVVVTYRMFSAGAGTGSANAAALGPIQFVAIYGLLSVALLVALHSQLAARRRGAG